MRDANVCFGWKADIARRPDFWLYSWMRGLIVATGIALGLPLNAAPVASGATVDSSGSVQSFYGIPINLTVSDLTRLPYRVTVRRVPAAEGGDDYTAVEIVTKDGVKVHVAFDTDGKLYAMRTTSPKAVAPKGIKVGSLLSAVRAAWPNGRLSYGFGENHAFASFSTGTNVTFSFDPKDMPRELIYESRKDIPVPDIRVRGIHIYPQALSIPEPCRPGYCS